ncbi:MAG: hypothetical protein ILO36_07570 [Abditibacteriota bacterium]|nr:hypothetical protein [Abditibacteriota bacterium]
MKKILLALLTLGAALPLLADEPLTGLIGKPVSLAEELYGVDAAGDGSVVFTDKAWFGAEAVTQLVPQNGKIDHIKVAFDTKADFELLKKNVQKELGKPDNYSLSTEGEPNTNHFYKDGLFWMFYMDDNSAAMTVSRSDFADYELYQVPADTILIQTAYGDVNGNGTEDRALLAGKPGEKGYGKLYLFVEDGETRERLQGTFNYKLDGGSEPSLLVQDVNGDGIDDICVSAYTEGGLAVHIGTFAGGKGKYRYILDPMDMFKGYTPVVRLTANYNACVLTSGKQLRLFSVEKYKEALEAMGVYDDKGKVVKPLKATVSPMQKFEITSVEDEDLYSLMTLQDVYFMDPQNTVCRVKLKYRWKRDQAEPVRTVVLEE